MASDTAYGDTVVFARKLEQAARGPILTIRCITGHPVYLLRSRKVASGDAKYNWTVTNLALLEIGAPATESTFQKCIALLYALEAHALGLPLPSNLEELRSSALETCALVRGYDRFVQNKHVGAFLPHLPRPVQSLCSAISARHPLTASHAGHRLAAVMIEANTFPMLRMELNIVLEIIFPGLARTTETIRIAEPSEAANCIMRWLRLSPKDCEYVYRRDRGASVMDARVHVLDSEFDVVVASTHPNSKGFSLDLRQLQDHMATRWFRPQVNVNHDRTIPPVGIIIGMWICPSEHNGDKGHQLHARIASLHAQGTRELSNCGGMSIAFHKR